MKKTSLVLADAQIEPLVPLVVGKRYLIREWDDSLSPVTLCQVKGYTVVIEYADGVRHNISVAYFQKALLSAA